MSQADNLSGASPGSLRSYAAGFAISLILTAGPFALVMSGVWSNSATLWAVSLAGVAQIVAHLHYFLHLDLKSGPNWNLCVLLFTVLIVAFFIGGTIWIMYNLYYRMM